MSADRGQSNVVGVAVLLGVTVVSMGVLTAAIGTAVSENAARADAVRVAEDFDATLSGVERTGRHRGQLAFTEGTLTPVERDLRVLDDEGVVRRVRVGALVFRANDVRVSFLSGAIVRDAGGAPRIVDPPPVTAGREVLLVGAVRLGAERTVSGSGGLTVPIRTRVTHERERLGKGNYRIAVETATPDPLAAHFRREGATVARRDIDGDGTVSVVARFPGRRTAYLVVHDLHSEVGRG